MFTLYHSKPVWFPSSVEDKEDILKNVGNQNVMDLTHWHENKTPPWNISPNIFYMFLFHRGKKSKSLETTGWCFIWVNCPFNVCKTVLSAVKSGKINAVLPQTGHLQPHSILTDNTSRTHQPPTRTNLVIGHMLPWVTIVIINQIKMERWEGWSPTPQTGCS